MAHNVVDIYLKDKIEIEPKKKELKDEKPKEIVSINENTLNTYVGDFELQPGFTISVTKNNDQLLAKATGQSTLSLIPISITEFKVESVEAKIEFVPNGGENINLIKLHQNDQIMEAQRLKAFDIASVNLSDFEGSYFSEELSTTYDFVVVDGKLMAQHSRLDNFGLNSVKEDMFSSEAWYFGEITFLRDSNNKITGCNVSSGRVRDLKFRKVE